MCMCVCVYPLTPLTHKHAHVQPQFLRGGRLRRLVHACFASLLKEYDDMHAEEDPAETLMPDDDDGGGAGVDAAGGGDAQGANVRGEM